MMKNILVPVDGSEGADRAIEQAVTLAKILREVPADIRTNSVVELGSPAEVIVETADDEGYDLVVMGSRGLGRLTGFLMGSVSQYVVEQSKCPVLVVK